MKHPSKDAAMRWATEESQVDGDMHYYPLDGKTHRLDKDCWCSPVLIADFTEQGGVKVYEHRWLQ